MEAFKKYLAEYGDYLEDLRKRLYRLVITFAVAFAVGFFLTNPLLRIFIRFLKISDVTITTTSPFQVVNLAMNTGLFFAIIVTLPLIVFQIYRFLSPGLLKRERRFFLTLLPVGLVLFITGFSYGFATLYFALKLIAQVNVSLGVANLWDIGQYISQMVLTSTLLGVIFQFPIVITFLIRLNIVKVDFLRSKRRHAIVAIFIFVSLLPPTDGLSLVVMSVPLIAIYELTIAFNSYGRSGTMEG